MGQPDLSSNSLISHPDVFADIINAIVYQGAAVVDERHLKPFYVNSSAVRHGGRLKGLYRDNCMEDVRSGIRYAIWGIENQYVPDRTTPFKVMGYDYTAYDRQIEVFMAQNKKENKNAFINGLLPEQKLKPVITLVLYYGAEDIPDNICAMMDMPEDAAVARYVQNYRLNMIRLKDFTPEQAELFQSDFACIAKFLAKSYNKEEQMTALKDNRQVLVHTKDTLFALAAITGDKRYLKISETSKEESKVCEIADAFEKIGYERGVEQGVEQGLKRGIAQGLKQGVAQGLKQGVAQGLKQAEVEREKGIQAMIEAFYELNADRDKALAKVAEKYGLEVETALEYMDKYWG